MTTLEMTKMIVQIVAELKKSPVPMQFNFEPSGKVILNTSPQLEEQIDQFSEYEDQL